MLRVLAALLREQTAVSLDCHAGQLNKPGTITKQTSMQLAAVAPQQSDQRRCFIVDTAT